MRVDLWMTFAGKDNANAGMLHPFFYLTYKWVYRLRIFVLPAENRLSKVPGVLMHPPASG